MVVVPVPQSSGKVPSRVFPLPGWNGNISTHWGKGIVGGSDLMVETSGTQPVVSMVSGKVSFVSSQATASRSGGNAVEIHGIDGLDYYYAHLARPLGLKPGDPVAAGQLLGLADTTGDAAGGPPHLHIGIGHGIQVGVGPAGGTGNGFDAVAALKALVNNPTANNPAIVSSATQQSITTNQPAGTISLAPPKSPATQSLTDRIQWLAQLLAAAGVPSNLIPQFVAISLAENGSSNPEARSPTQDIGLFQVNIPIWAQKLGLTVDQLKDPLTNAKAAYSVYKAQGFGAWVTFQLGLDKQFLAPVQAALAGIDLGGSVDTGGDGGSSGGGNDCGCGVMLHTPFGDIPDLGCMFDCTINKIIQQWKDNFVNWWNTWKDEHIANWLFVVAGAALVLISVSLLAGSNKTVQSAVKVAAAG